MSGGTIRPPRWAARLIALSIREAARGPILGDIEERFVRRARHLGPAAARRWYLRQTLSFVVRVPIDRLSFGSIRISRGLAAAGRDLSFAARSLRARPGFALPVVGVFALAIAANTLVFSLVDGVLVRRLPYPDPDSLVLLWDRPLGETPRDAPVTPRHFDSWRDRTDLFSTVGAFESAYSVVRWSDGTELTNARYITPELLDALGARPALGRLLQPEDSVEGADPVLVLSHRTWARRFGADAEVIGAQIVVDGVPTRIVGVLPEEFWFYDPYMYVRSVGARENADATFWMPLARRGHDQDDYPALRVLARLRADVDLDAAADAVAAHRLGLATADGRDAITSELTPLREQMLGDFEADLGLLTGAVLMVFAIACFNVASLMMSRSAARRQELWVRRALGAGDWAIIRTVLAENVWLALAGGLAGLLLAVPLLSAVVRMTPREMPLVHRVDLDVRVAVGTLVLAVVGGLLVGVVQARRVLRERKASPGRGRTVTYGTDPARFVLTAAQVAVSIALLVGAASTASTFVGLRDSDPGFRAESVLMVRAMLWRDDPASSTFLSELVERIEQMPGVRAVGGARPMPFSGWGRFASIRPTGSTDAYEPVDVAFRSATVSYFDTLEIPVRSGRVFDPADDVRSASVALLSESAARILFPDADPVGKLIDIHVGTRPADTRQVVGVVGDVAQRRLGEPLRPTLYVPTLQTTSFGLDIAVRTSAEPLALIPAIRAAARELDPRHPVGEFAELEALLAATITQQRFFARLLGVFGAVALTLASTGLYGMVACAARGRVPEMGIRKALGARAGALLRMMLLSSLRPVAVGVALGVPSAVALDRLLAATVPGVSVSDPARIALVAVTFTGVALAAAFVPARQAGAVDPVQALRTGE